MRKPFIYRYKGNCLANCIVKGCELQGDSNLNTKIPEISIFDLEILKNIDETKEFEPALCYLINNNYKVKIIDPNPYNNTWGRCFKNDLLYDKVRSFEKEDIENFSTSGWSVIFSTLGSNNKPHAVLSHKGILYDPQTNSWKPTNLDVYIKRSLRESRGRFLIAFKKF